MIFKKSKKDVKPGVDSKDSPKQPSRLRDSLSLVGVILLALVFALTITTFVFRSYAVDGPSMEPTLQNNDKLIIWKVPRTWAMITGHQYVPARGDIIVFNENNLSQCDQTGTKQLIKRVIGLPGEKVVINGGVVTVYNSKHPHGFQPDNTLPYNKTHFIPYTNHDETIQLNSHQLFVMGDNRGVSCDSRSFGPINTSQIVGQLVLRILPIGNTNTF
ncbi:MAG: signal peptidase I [Candidatus Saccharimonadales bacterium]